MCFGPIVAQFTAYVLGAEDFVTEFVPVLLAILQLVVFSSLWYAVILLSGPLGYPCLRGALKMDTQGLPGQTIRLHALVTGLTALGVVLADTFSFVEPPPPADSIF